MAQSLTSGSMSRVNRRFMLLALILAALSAVLVYAALSGSSGSDGGGAVASNVPVVVAQVDIPPGAPITADMLGVATIPEALVIQGAFASIDSVVGETARYPIAINQQVLLSDVVSGPGTASNDVLVNILVSGERGLAIKTEPVTNAGGLLLPGDFVDVYWVPSDPDGDVEGAQLLAEDAQVVAVEQVIVSLPAAAPGLFEDGEEPPASSPDDRVRSFEEDPIPGAVTVTLMVNTEEIQRIFCGEQTGTLRLAVRAFGDHGSTGLQPVDCIILGQGQG